MKKVFLQGLSLIGALVASAFFAGSVNAQAMGQSRVSVELRGGLLNATEALGRTGVLGSPASGYVAFEEVETAPLLGAALSVGVAGPLTVRILADFAPEADVSGQFFCEAFTACPAVLQLVSGRASRHSFGLDAQYHLGSLRRALQSTVFLGVIRQSHQIDWDVPVPEVPIPTTFSKSDFYLRPGIGLTRPIGRFGVFLEADARIGKFGAEFPQFIEGTIPPDAGTREPETQVDLGLTLGVRMNIG